MNHIPRRDETSPIATRTMTRRGFGFCTGTNAAVKYDAGCGMRLGFACRHGFGYGFGREIVVNQTSYKTEKALLQE
jgi:hypothetical protein